MGTLLAAVGRYTEAGQEYVKALRLFPDRGDYWDDLGVNQIQLGDRAGVSSCLESLSALLGPEAENRTVERLVQTARSFLGRGEIVPARDIYGMVLKHFPRHERSLFGLGLVEFKLGRFSEAWDCLRKAMDLNPGCYEYQEASALFLKRLGKFREAKVFFESALEIRPDSPELLIEYEAIFERLDPPENFFDFLESHRRRHAVSPDTLQRLGYNFNSLTKYHLAEICFTGAANLDPGSAESWRELGRVLTVLERTDEAAAALARAIKLDPQDAKTLTAKGNLFHKQERWAEAVEQYRLALAVDPKIFRPGSIWGSFGGKRKITRRPARPFHGLLKSTPITGTRVGSWEWPL